MDLHEKAIKLWEYLADNPQIGKVDAYIELGFQDDELNCPACQYTVNLTGEFNCNVCPIRGSWVTSDGIEFTDNCLDDDSAFNSWASALSNADRKRSAGLVLESVRDWWEEVE